MAKRQLDKVASDLAAKRLLGRGGRILGLAALAYARGQRASKGPWYAMSPDTVAAAEEVLAFLEEQPDPSLVESAIRLAMSPGPATAAPSWAEPLWKDPTAISRLGGSLDTPLLLPALGSRRRDPSARLKGLAAVSIALCRSLDGLGALARFLPEEDGAAAVRMGQLAQATVGPGEPSRMRARIRGFLRGEKDRG